MSKTKQRAAKQLAILAAAGAAMLLAGCETTDMHMGSSESNTVATGSAAGSTTSGANDQLQHCAAPLGTVSLVENQSAGWYTVLTGEYKLPPTSNLLRMLIQQSNCFVVVERSAAGLHAMDRERALQDSGEMRGGSHYGKGQIVASDYGLSPEIEFSTDNAGGIGGVLGGLIGGRRGGALAQIGASTQTRQASAMLTLVDNRSGVQVASSTGSASKTDLNLFGGAFGRNGGGQLGGYTNTPQGKVIAAAFMDAYNQMVVSLRGYRAQSVSGQGLGGGGKLGVDGGAAPSRTYVPGRGGNTLSVRQAQQRLNDKGYDIGTPDGGLGPRTTKALRAFQKDQGLPVTGRLDAATKDALSQ